MSKKLPPAFKLPDGTECFWDEHGNISCPNMKQDIAVSAKDIDALLTACEAVAKAGGLPPLPDYVTDYFDDLGDLASTPSEWEPVAAGAVLMAKVPDAITGWIDDGPWANMSKRDWEQLAKAAKARANKKTRTVSTFSRNSAGYYQLAVAVSVGGNRATCSDGETWDAEGSTPNVGDGFVGCKHVPLALVRKCAKISRLIRKRG